MLQELVAMVLLDFSSNSFQWISLSDQSYDGLCCERRVRQACVSTIRATSWNTSTQRAMGLKPLSFLIVVFCYLHSSFWYRNPVCANHYDGFSLMTVPPLFNQASTCPSHQHPISILTTTSSQTLGTSLFRSFHNRSYSKPLRLINFRVWRKLWWIFHAGPQIKVVSEGVSLDRKHSALLFNSMNRDFLYNSLPHSSSPYNFSTSFRRMSGLFARGFAMRDSHPKPPCDRWISIFSIEADSTNSNVKILTMHLTRLPFKVSIFFGGILANFGCTTLVFILNLGDLNETSIHASDHT